MGLFADVLGAFEHHVLEEVGEAGAAGALVEGADVVPEVDGDEGQAVIFVGDDGEAVGEGVLLVLNLGELDGGGESGGGEGAEEAGGEGGAEGHRVAPFCIPVFLNGAEQILRRFYCLRHLPAAGSGPPGREGGLHL